MFFSFIVGTYDVQSAAGSTNDASNNITMTGEFIKNTTAKGCFVVLQCEDTLPDVFRVLLLPDTFNDSVNSTITNIPPSTYHLLVYDLEEDGLPNRNPAVEQSSDITVEKGECLLAHTTSVCCSSTFIDSESDPESLFLTNASALYLNESAVMIRCEFKEGIDGSSCVLVYREYGNKTLVVKEYPQNNTDLTAAVDDDLQEYTFAIFGKNDEMVDERPIFAGRAMVDPETTIPSTTTSTNSGKSS